MNVSEDNENAASDRAIIDRKLPAAHRTKTVMDFVDLVDGKCHIMIEYQQI